MLCNTAPETTEVSAEITKEKRKQTRWFYAKGLSQVKSVFILGGEQLGSLRIAWRHGGIGQECYYSRTETRVAQGSLGPYVWSLVFVLCEGLSLAGFEQTMYA